MYAHTYIQTYIYIPTRTHVYTHIHIYTYITIYIHTYKHTDTPFKVFIYAYIPSKVGSAD